MEIKDARNIPFPEGWGNDELSGFLKIAIENSLATFLRLKEPFSRLVEITEIFLKANEYLKTKKEWLEHLFFLRAHSSFLSAVLLGSAGQMPETFMVLRGAIENALYGFYISKDSTLAKTWLERHKDEKSLKEVKEKFKIGNIWALLEAEDRDLRLLAEKLYNQAIDYGAHPNEKSISTILTVLEEEKATEFKLAYLSGDKQTIEFCLKSAARVGVTCLKIWETTHKRMFELSLLSSRLKKASEGL